MTDETGVDQAAETAAFESSFEGTDAATPTVEPAPEATPVPEQPPEAAPTAPTPKADDFDARAELRKMHGRMGALNDQLQQALRAKEAEVKTAAAQPVKLTRLKAEFGELAELLEDDISEVVKGLGHQKVDPREIDNLVSKRVADEVFNMRRESITDTHENWETDCWADQPGGTRTPEYQAWINTMSAPEASAFENSQNPAFVNRKLNQFYDWKNKLAKTETEKQQRLKAAVTPQGTARAGSQTMSDDEALRKGFNEGFSS